MLASRMSRSLHMHSFRTSVRASWQVPSDRHRPHGLIYSKGCLERTKAIQRLAISFSQCAQVAASGIRGQSLEELVALVKSCITSRDSFSSP